MKIPLKELGLDMDKKSFKPGTAITCMGKNPEDWPSEIMGLERGYNQRISYEDELVLEIDEEKLANRLSISNDDLELNKKDGIERAFYIQQAKELCNNIKSFLSIQKGE